MVPIAATLTSIALLAWFASRHFASVRAGVIAAALFATMPMVWIAVRDGAPQLLLLPLVAAWLVSFDEYFRSGKPYWLAAGGVALALAVYAHLTGIVMAPVYAAIAVLALIVRRESPSRVMLFVAAFAVIASPWAIATLREPDSFAAAVNRYGLYDAGRFNVLQGARELTSWTGLTVRSEVYWDSFSPALLFLGKGGLANSLLRPEVFLLPFAVPFCLGLIRSVRRPDDPAAWLLLAALAAAPVVVALLAQPPVPGRLLLMAPVAALIATRGFSRLA
jgi:4-amino-4-deoxy-L-arabinose transferase-like glycosyltransferase